VSLSRRRVRAIIRKELREYRRNSSIVLTMALVPVIFVVPLLIEVPTLPASASVAFLHGDPLAYLLGIPALVPAAVAAYSVVGEREQGTLEPVLTTPIRHEELLLGKALASMVPSLLISYLVYALFLGWSSCSRGRRWPRPSSAARCWSPRCCSRRSWSPGRSGSEPRFRPEPATSGWPSSSARWRASL
jgi:ABC-type Na+ efflux pump permease subunit